MINWLRNAKKWIAQRVCKHEHKFIKQTWVRIEQKKFELKNEVVCSRCENRKVLPIG